MKISGICGKQSARKHRQRGDYVIHLRGFPGRYTWLRYSTLRPFEKVSARQVRQEQRTMFYNAKLAEAVTASGQAQLLLMQERLVYFGVDHAAPGTQSITGKNPTIAIVDEVCRETKN